MMRPFHAIAAAFITVACSVMVPVAIASQTEGEKSSLSPYDREVYELAYAVFLGNSNLADALLLARSAVKQRPYDLVWRKRLAQVAVWTQRPELALEQWILILEREKSISARNEVIRLARLLRRDEVVLQMVKSQLGENPTEHLWREYLDLAEGLGAVDDALATLLAAKQRPSATPYLYEQLVRLSEHKGAPSQALHYLNEEIARFGLSTDRSMHQARINYSLGNSAEALANLWAARNSALPGETSYWQTLGDLAWMQQEKQIVLYAAWTLVSRNSARSIDIERLVAILKDSDPSEAWKLAQRGWKNHGTSFYFLSMLDIGVARKWWTDLDTVFRDLTEQQQEMLFSMPYVWSTRVQVLEHLGKKREAVAVYRNALSRFPEDDDFVSGLIWLLIDLRDRDNLRKTLAEFRALALSSAEVRTAFGSAHVFLGNDAAALPFFEADYKERSGDVAWLVSYADLLERLRKVKNSEKVRQHAWGLAQKDPAALEKAMGNQDLRTALARLGLSFAPGDTADALMTRLFSRVKTETDREMVLLWAVASERDDLARRWLRKQIGANPPNPPPWVDMTVALRDNDGDKLAVLLDTRAEELPVRDRVEAARRLGRYEESRDLAYRGLQREPEDEELRRQYADLVILTANRVEATETYEKRGGLDQVRSQLSGSYALWPGLRVRPSVVFATQSISDHSQFGTVPRQDIAAELGASLFIPHGTIEVGAGWRQGVAGFASARLLGERQIAADLGVSLLLGYRQRATESIPLLVAGTRDHLTAQMTWQPAHRDTIALTAEAQLYHDQEYNRLGTGQRISLNYSSRLEIQSPGLDLVSGLTAQRFTRNGAPGNAAAEIVPSQGPPDARFFLPRDFVQLDLGLYSDRSFISSYIRRWKLFGGAGVALNSQSGIGYNAEFGAVGPLFGHDRLTLLFKQGTDRFGASSSVLSGELSYTHFLEH